MVKHFTTRVGIARTFFCDKCTTAQRRRSHKHAYRFRMPSSARACSHFLLYPVRKKAKRGSLPSACNRRLRLVCSSSVPRAFDARLGETPHALLRTGGRRIATAKSEKHSRKNSRDPQRSRWLLERQAERLLAAAVG